MPEEIRLKRDPKLPFQEIEGETVVIVPARREMHQLDPVGTFLWIALQKGRTAHELVEALCGEFEVEPVPASEDVKKFLQAAREKGLVVPA